MRQVAALSEFDAMVLLMTARNIPRDKAERAAREALGIVDNPGDIERDARILEKAEQVEIRKIAIAYGFKVRNLSQYRPSKVAPGFADLFMTHKREPIALWWETKRQVGGERSTSQIEFGDDCIRCNERYGFGDRYTFVEKLLELELAVRGAGQYGIEPIRRIAAPSSSSQEL